MPELDQTIAKTLLTDFGLWNVPNTFYETERFSNSAATYRFGCHQQHSSFTVKIDEAKMMAFLAQS